MSCTLPFVAFSSVCWCLKITSHIDAKPAPIKSKKNSVKISGLFIVAFLLPPSSAEVRIPPRNSESSRVYDCLFQPTWSQLVWILAASTIGTIHPISSSSSLSMQAWVRLLPWSEMGKQNQLSYGKIHHFWWYFTVEIVGFFYCYASFTGVYFKPLCPSFDLKPYQKKTLNYIEYGMGCSEMTHDPLQFHIDFYLFAKNNHMPIPLYATSLHCIEKMQVFALPEAILITSNSATTHCFTAIIHPHVDPWTSTGLLPYKLRKCAGPTSSGWASTFKNIQKKSSQESTKNQPNQRIYSKNTQRNHKLMCVFLVVFQKKSAKYVPSSISQGQKIFGIATYRHISHTVHIVSRPSIDGRGRLRSFLGRRFSWAKKKRGRWFPAEK